MFSEQTGINYFEIIIWALFAGLIIATVYSVYIKAVIGKIVKALIKAKADNPENAKSFKDLNLKKSKLLKYALTRSNAQAYRVISVAGKDTGMQYKRTKIDVYNEKFFISEKNADMAKMIYGQKGSGILVPIVAAVIFIVFAFLIIRYAPTLIDKIVETFNNNLK